MIASAIDLRFKKQEVLFMLKDTMVPWFIPGLFRRRTLALLLFVSLRRAKLAHLYKFDVKIWRDCVIPKNSLDTEISESLPQAEWLVSQQPYGRLNACYPPVGRMARGPAAIGVDSSHYSSRRIARRPAALWN